jgi:hypothetical protein
MLPSASPSACAVVSQVNASTWRCGGAAWSSSSSSATVSSP